MRANWIESKEANDKKWWIEKNHNKISRNVSRFSRGRSILMAIIYCKHEAPRQRWIDGWVGVVVWLIEADEAGVTEKAGDFAGP